MSTKQLWSVSIVPLLVAQDSIAETCKKGTYCTSIFVVFGCHCGGDERCMSDGCKSRHCQEAKNGVEEH